MIINGLNPYQKEIIQHWRDTSSRLTVVAEDKFDFGDGIRTVARAFGSRNDRSIITAINALGDHLEEAWGGNWLFLRRDSKLWPAAVVVRQASNLAGDLRIEVSLLSYAARRGFELR